tara:strand:+ start:42 stop:392 length:351 start_codon:yes stop_codon:yes gene_type:complete
MVLNENEKYLAMLSCIKHTTYETRTRYGDAIEVRIIWDGEQQIIPRPPFKLYNITTLEYNEECVEITNGDDLYLLGAEMMYSGETYSECLIADYKNKLLNNELDDDEAKWLKMMTE